MDMGLATMDIGRPFDVRILPGASLDAPGDSIGWKGSGGGACDVDGFIPRS